MLESCFFIVCPFLKVRNEVVSPSATLKVTEKASFWPLSSRVNLHAQILKLV